VAVRVLVVEDGRALAGAVQRGLNAQGLLTDVAYDGPSGLDAALSGAYDVIVLDLMLPGMNGYDVCRQLRAADVWTRRATSLPDPTPRSEPAAGLVGGRPATGPCNA
jgi:DNA-binding response OmpR family regulator